MQTKTSHKKQLDSEFPSKASEVPDTQVWMTVSEKGSKEPGVKGHLDKKRPGTFLVLCGLWLFPSHLSKNKKKKKKAKLFQCKHVK